MREVDGIPTHGFRRATLREVLGRAARGGCRAPRVCLAAPKGSPFLLAETMGEKGDQ